MALAGGVLAARGLRLHLAGLRRRADRGGHVERRHGLDPLSSPATPSLRNAMDTQASPEFSDYIHAIARRQALLFGIAIPIAVLAILLSLTLPNVYTSSGLVEIDTPSTAQSLQGNGNGESDYADQYVQNLKGIVLTDTNLRKLVQEHHPYPDLEDDESAMLKRLRRDIN